jgi:hypothetical protein
MTTTPKTGVHAAAFTALIRASRTKGRPAFSLVAFAS